MGEPTVCVWIGSPTSCLLLLVTVAWGMASYPGWLCGVCGAGAGQLGSLRAPEP